MLSIEVTAFFEHLCREQLASFNIIARYLDERFFFSQGQKSLGRAQVGPVVSPLGEVRLGPSQSELCRDAHAVQCFQAFCGDASATRGSSPGESEEELPGSVRCGRRLVACKVQEACVGR